MMALPANRTRRIRVPNQRTETNNIGDISQTAILANTAFSPQKIVVMTSREYAHIVAEIRYFSILNKKIP